MKLLYHGSNVKVTNIDLSKSKPGKDFGKGFYLNPNLEQAIELANAKADFLGGEPIISAFELNDEEIKKGRFKVKTFPDYNEEWANFVLQNRKNRSDEQCHDYDIVIGPIADDRVGVQIRRFANGYLTAKQLVEELKYKEPTIQYFFGTEESLKCLKSYEC